MCIRDRFHLGQAVRARQGLLQASLSRASRLKSAQRPALRTIVLRGHSRQIGLLVRLGRPAESFDPRVRRTLHGRQVQAIAPTHAHPVAHQKDLAAGQAARAARQQEERTAPNRQGRSHLELSRLETGHTLQSRSRQNPLSQVLMWAGAIPRDQPPARPTVTGRPQPVHLAQSHHVTSHSRQSRDGRSLRPSKGRLSSVHLRIARLHRAENRPSMRMILAR